jgi:hypothetical protein
MVIGDCPFSQAQSQGEEAMKKTKVVVLSLCLGLLSIVFLPKIRADEWDKKTTMTFDQPVEIPGKVLSAGKYVFKLADSSTDRHIVQILSSDERHVYATILAIADERRQPTGKTVVTFEERAAGSPEAIKAWFYPGDETGNEFVYPKQQALQIAKNSNESIPVLTSAASASQPAEPTAAVPTAAESPSVSSEVAALKQEPVKAVTPSGDEVEVKETQIAQAAPLPKTASEWPLLLVLGLASLLAVVPVRYALKNLQ